MISRPGAAVEKQSFCRLTRHPALKLVANGLYNEACPMGWRKGGDGAMHWLTALLHSLLLLGSLLLPASLYAQDPDHVMELVSTAVLAGETVEVPLLFDNAQPLAGYQVTAAHDPAQLTILEVAPGQITIDLFPDFLQAQLFPDGFTLAVVYMQAGYGHLPSGTQQEVHRIVYEVDSAMPPGSSPVSFSSDIGNPPFPSLMVGWLTGTSIEPILIDGSVEVAESLMLRGDTNQDGDIDLADPIHMILWLFQGGDEVPCIEAADTNDDASVDIGDVMTSLNYLFLNSPGALSGTCEATAPTGPLSCVIPDCL